MTAEAGNSEDVIFNVEAGAYKDARALLLSARYPQPPITEGHCCQSSPKQRRCCSKPHGYLY